jgi:protein TonB
MSHIASKPLAVQNCLEFKRFFPIGGAMPTITEIPKAAPKAVAEKPVAPPWPEPPKAPPFSEYKPMFSDSLIGGTGEEMKRKTATTTFSFIFQCVLLAIMALIPLMFTEALPKGQLLTFLVAPPPPPPPPPPAAPTVKVVRETDVLNSGALRTPSRIPKKVEMIKEEDTPPPSQTGGVVGGIPGGIPGGQLGGVIGGIIGSTSSITAVPKLEPVKRIRVSQGVTQGLLVHKVEPQYPKIALAARITGVVQLKAIIGKDGNIRELQTLSGPPLLVPSAIDAVKQWHYRPYLLNGEAVEVETSVTVTFQLSGAS